MTPDKYFEKALIEYLIPDLEHLINTCTDQEGKDHAGPILTVTCNGIDIAGGILYGFKKPDGNNNSQDRFVKFMKNELKLYDTKLHKNVAIFLYKSVRCGMAHEGAPKYGVNFATSSNSEEAIFKNFENIICIDCTQFARKFMNAITNIWKSEKPKLKGTPWNEYTESPLRYLNPGATIEDIYQAAIEELNTGLDYGQQSSSARPEEN
ncbi:hypothetical protein KAH55_11680 [bacterium]|nr:hypothetical protein [bacterium]